ncbi:hypothetical protein B0T26DRAFT_697333 [Lasiosphaeria miniovina]|uniref:Uncharacterized protein n=1 Tax=Lasiosphaeria miniovina TaxID=1954250 RepID=A0AA40B5T4_9PEZI|nr:uncharacterized protein B0T26DRAFT_697333 [Lasiosphaeria miniovina]KAK0728234.1 hypothetical protein B0T26DRAFT_697333 [Lasiosphaeria miniovina]
MALGPFHSSRLLHTPQIGPTGSSARLTCQTRPRSPFRLVRAGQGGLPVLANGRP